MPDIGELLTQWGYLALFLIVVLGNVGLPVPEETVLITAGYLVWRGHLWLPAVLVVGIASAAAGDNLGYWLGRRYGRRAVGRYAQWVLVRPERVEICRRFVGRYGAWGVFVGRFLPVLRFLAGPLAGATGLGFVPFIVGNVLGAALFVPYAVGIGLALGFGLGTYVERLQRIEVEIGYVFLLAVTMSIGMHLGWRVLKAIRANRGT
jgi:membrane protein DedA with SNARE-associated domain